jgi:hypothetical protein
MYKYVMIFWVERFRKLVSSEVRRSYGALCMGGVFGQVFDVMTKE